MPLLVYLAARIAEREAEGERLCVGICGCYGYLGSPVTMVTDDFLDWRFFHISYHRYTKQTTLSRLVTSASTFRASGNFGVGAKVMSDPVYVLGFSVAMETGEGVRCHGYQEFPDS